MDSEQPALLMKREETVTQERDREAIEKDWAPSGRHTQRQKETRRKAGTPRLENVSRK